MAALVANLPLGWAGRVFASDAPETSQLRIGIIALTDCSSIVMAYEKGFFKEQGLEVTISKEASWAVIRDKLQLGENQTTHMLYGMPYASTIQSGRMSMEMNATHGSSMIACTPIFSGTARSA